LSISTFKQKKVPHVIVKSKIWTLLHFACCFLSHLTTHESNRTSRKISFLYEYLYVWYLRAWPYSASEIPQIKNIVHIHHKISSSNHTEMEEISSEITKRLSQVMLTKMLQICITLLLGTKAQLEL